MTGNEFYFMFEYVKIDEATNAKNLRAITILRYMIRREKNILRKGNR